MKATIKTKEEIIESCVVRTSDGFHFKGQYFPNENLEFCGLEVEGELWSSGLVLECEIAGEWHFFSVDALHITH